MRIKKRKISLILFTIFFNSSVYATFSPYDILFIDYQTITGLYGDRASGMGGAFTAVSDDPSGAYYNPAGISFSPSNSLSISGNAYRLLNIYYQDVEGPGTSYLRKSEDFFPNFIGATRNITDDLALSLSYINTKKRDSNSTVWVTNPPYRPDLERISSMVSEYTNEFMIGPSISYKIKKNFSIGASFYYLRHFSKSSVIDTYTYTDKSWENYIVSEQKKVLGYNPVVGLMYMPIEKLSLGVSLQRKFVTGGTRNNYLMSMGSFSPIGDDVYYVHGDANSLRGVFQNKLSYLSPLGAVIPQTSEFRLGAAYFLSDRFLLSADYIRISGYSKKRTQMEFITYNAIPQLIYYGDKEYETYRKPTDNFAVGLEWDIATFLTLRLGFFTNRSSNIKKGWLESTIENYIRQNNTPATLSEDENLSIQYFPSRLIRPYYADYSNPKGFSVGLSYTDESTMLTFTHIREIGNDMTFYYPTNPPVNLYYTNQVYNISITSKK